MEVQLKLDQYGTHASLYIGEHTGPYFNNLLKKFAQKYNVRFLDLLSIYEHNKLKGLYSNRDGHLTETGHQITAGALLDYLQQNNILP